MSTTAPNKFCFYAEPTEINAENGQQVAVGLGECNAHHEYIYLGVSHPCDYTSASALLTVDQAAEVIESLQNAIDVVRMPV